MTTATMEKQTKTQPAPEAPPLAADSRAGRFCLALDAMTNPAAYLAPPPPGTAFGDLMAVWETGIEPNTARPLFASLDDLASERRSKLGGAS
ncbi:MAG TPA: hypothetical protein VG013_13955, partial [Gemmataceae bacterium]|nr:hypothetical protein [Gemmataceae bacterium]